MGYTHYWYQKRDVTDSEWDDFLSDFEKMSAALPADTGEFATLYGAEASGYGRGGGLPLQVVTEKKKRGTEIWIEGVGEWGHETAVLTKKQKARDKWVELSEYKKDGAFNFCKTARKPYDVLVCAALLVLAARAPGAFELSTDGEPSSWAGGLRFARRTTGVPADLSALGFEESDELSEAEKLCPAELADAEAKLISSVTASGSKKAAKKQI